MYETNVKESGNHFSSVLGHINIKKPLKHCKSFGALPKRPIFSCSIQYFI